MILMYQAIVFLPLLGAILAGLIALFGARARFPGEAPPPGDDDTQPTHAHASCRADAHGGGVIHHAHRRGVTITATARSSRPRPVRASSN